MISAITADISCGFMSNNQILLWGIIMELNASIKEKILMVLEEYKITKAGIYGSYARGEADESSDIDIVVESTRRSLFELVGLKQDIEDATGLKVDITTYQGLNNSPREGFKEKVEEDEVNL